METAAKYILVDSADRTEGTVQNFRIQLQNPIHEVKHITLMSTNILRDASMTDYLLVRISAATGEIRTSDEIIATYFVPVDSTATNIIYKIGIDGVQKARACQTVIYDLRVEILNHDGTIPTISDYVIVFRAD